MTDPLKDFLEGKSHPGVPDEPVTVHLDDAEVIWDKDGSVQTVSEDPVAHSSRPKWVDGSTSYPFLAVARANNVDYGLVLSYADLLRKRVSCSGEESYRDWPTYWEHPSRFDEGSQWAADTRTAMLVEGDRQARQRAIDKRTAELDRLAEKHE